MLAINQPWQFLCLRDSSPSLLARLFHFAPLALYSEIAISWFRWQKLLSSRGGLADWEIGLSGSFFRGGFCGAGGTGKLDAGRLGDLVQISFATSGGVLLHEILLDGFVVFRLSPTQSFGGGVGFESLQGSFDRFFELSVVLSALFRLPSGFFGRFDNWHMLSISYYIKKLVIEVIITNFDGDVKGGIYFLVAMCVELTFGQI